MSINATADHPLRPMMIEQREVLIGHARLYHRWRESEGLEPGLMALFVELENNAVQSIRSLEQWLGYSRPWMAD